MKFWQCTVCKYIHKGDTPPEKCPICGVDASKFVEIDEADIPQKAPKTRKPVEKPTQTQTKVETGASTIQEPPAEKGLEKIKSLMVKNHAHPICVHSPNGIVPMVIILLLVAWFTNKSLFSQTAFINMFFVIISLPFVIITGIIEWEKKYQKAMTKIFKLKIVSAAVATLACLISFIWYFLDSQVLSSPNAWIFIAVNIIMAISVAVAGHIGGKLVFKD